jgi:hypothetical protein
VLLFVADEPAWKKVRLNKYLETIADAKNRKAFACFFDDGIHYRSLGSDCSAAKVVPVAKATG